MIDDPALAGPASWPDIARWRKAERERLIAARLAIPADARAVLSARIAERLDGIVGDVGGRIVSLYWPFRGEPDLRPWMASDRRARRHACPARRRGKGPPAGLSRLQARRPAGKGRLEHSRAGRRTRRSSPTS